MPPAIDVARLRAILTADTSQFQQGMRGATSGFEKFAVTVGKIAKVAAGVTVGMTTALGGVGVALGKLAKEAAPVEQLAAAFGGLTQDIEGGAAAMLGALRESSSGMISNRDLMESFNLAAQLVSEDFAEQLPGAMQYLSKVAAATGTDMNYMMDSLVRGVGRMSPLILDNLGIQVRLEEATERAAEMFGVQAEELSKAQQQAGLTALVMERLQENTADIPDVAGTAQQSIATFQASLVNLKDDIGLAVLPVFGELINVVSQLAAQYGPLLVETLGAVARAVMPIVQYVGELVLTGEPLNDYLAQLAPGLQAVVNAVLGIVEWVKQAIEAVRPFVEQIAAWFDENVKLQDVLIALAAVVLPSLVTLIAGTLLPAIGALIAAVGPVILVFAAVMGAAIVLRKAWESNFGGIRDITLAVTTKIREGIEAFLTAVRAWWDEHGERVIEIVTKLWNGIQSVAEFVLDNLRTVIEAFQLALEGDWYGFGQKLREGWDRAWAQIKEIAQAAIEWFKSVDWGEIGRAIIQGIAKGITAATGAIKDAAKRAAKAALEAAKGFLGIHSASAVFAEIGEQMMVGLAQGIASNVQLPTMATVYAAGMSTAGAAGLMDELRAIRTTIHNTDRSAHVHVNANYADRQSESDVARDVRTVLELMGWR